MYIKSPLNYTGGKYKILPQILPLFPSNINTFVDLFGGGFNVGINVNAKQIIYNDVLVQLKNMLEYFYNNDTTFLLNQIEEIIDFYNLSKENKDGFLELRKYYNSFNSEKWDSSTLLYTLICYSFNNQIRFNSKKEFNMPFGKDRSCFNQTLKDKFTIFCDELKNKNIKFTSNDFTKFQVTKLSQNDFIYLDPPYFNTIATYNENGGWDDSLEYELRKLCEEIDFYKIKFALSNDLSKNLDLQSWVENNNYKIHYINHSYSNCNYQKKVKENAKEVLITNY